MASAAAAHSVSNVNGRSDNMNSVSDEGSVKHFSADCNWPMSAYGINAVTAGTTQFAIFYKGSMCVYDGIPAEKVHEIMLIAAAAATKSAEMKSGIPFPSLIPTSPSSPQGTSNNLASPQSVCFPVEKSSICRLQEFPIARRQSLESFLEKRRIRLGSKAPYTSSTAKAANNIENLNVGNSPEFGASLNDQRKDFSPVLLPLGGN